jgi:hypothetical protein
MIHPDNEPETGNQLPTPSVPKRPVLLTVLCILTFIGSGMNIFSGLIISLFHDTFLTIAEELSENLDLPGIEVILQAPPVFFLSSALLYAGSLTGAVMMWNLRRNGFHVYAISQILHLIAPMYFLKLAGPSIIDLIFSGIFIILYSLNLKFMK